jgi:hypothetical protein
VLLHADTYFAMTPTQSDNVLEVDDPTVHAAETQVSTASTTFWGLTYVPNCNALGLSTAGKLICVQHNDASTHTEKTMDVLVDCRCLQ